ncbi:MAG: SpoVA/SpoVAEb family sporulation membrane protein [Bacilli bacterium]
MDTKKYQKIVDKNIPKENVVNNCIRSFIVGGLIGVLGELIIQIYTSCGIPSQDAGTFMIITLIFIGSLLTALGFFDTAVGYIKAGFIVPITGFAHAMTSAALDHKREGFITGIGANIFKLSGSVILYGIVSAYIFGLIRLFIFGG